MQTLYFGFYEGLKVKGNVNYASPPMPGLYKVLSLFIKDIASKWAKALF